MYNVNNPTCIINLKSHKLSISKTAVRTSDKRYFVDPSIAAGMLKSSPKKLFGDMNTFGLLFESLVIRDLKIYTQTNGGSVFHYRDKTGLEADAIIHLNDNKWGLVEVKLGNAEFDKASENLLKLEERIDTEKLGKPAFKMIITSTGYAYKRQDGVIIVPIGCLKE
jgi:predicted AAA+ superfamily ATPase